MEANRTDKLVWAASPQRLIIMNRADLVARVAETTGLPKSTADMAVNTIFNALTDSLAQGEGVAIAGFGNFTVTLKTARRSIFPQLMCLVSKQEKH